MIWVIDASVALRWLIEDETHPHADDVLQIWWRVPMDSDNILDFECASQFPPWFLW